MGRILGLVFCLCLSACALNEDEQAPLTPAQTTQPPQSGGSRPPPSDMRPTGGGPPAPATCALGEVFRCLGDTVQTCNFDTHRWEDFQRCAAVGQRCSSDPADCGGFVENCAVCVER